MSHFSYLFVKNPTLVKKDSTLRIFGMAMRIYTYTLLATNSHSIILSTSKSS